MSTLSVVATPIGNLGDISQRALDVIRNADIILCEDTRETKKILNRYDIIDKKTISYHAHSDDKRVSDIVEYLKQGMNIVLVSDAGTPGISDPGIYLVSELRSRLADEISKGDIKIEAIPGASALTAAISIAGLPCADFTFLGFLPHKKGRETLFNEIKDSKRTMIFYESPHRIMKSLESLATILDDKRKVAVIKELTKIHEEVFVGSAVQALEYFKSNADKVRGEFVVIVN